MAQRLALTLKERKEQEKQRELKIAQALAGRKKVLENAKRDAKQKKKTVGELLSMVKLGGIHGRALRGGDTYIPRSYNLDKQLVGLLNHMYVQYPVPAFLYQACLPTDDEFEKQHQMYRQWFVTLAQGGSFQKLVKDYLTGREAYVLLSAPASRRIHENVWWAKMKVAGIPNTVSEKLIDRIFGNYFFDDPDGRLAEVIQFFGRFHGEMNKVTFGEITDFLAWKLRNDPEFRMKGRTIGSVVKLTNEWHRHMQKAGLSHKVEWKGLEMSQWELVERDQVWVVVELLNNRDLINEGRKQRHCVYSYVHWCSAGHSFIFSMRAYRKVRAGYTDEGNIIWDRSSELNRLTVEVNERRTVCQVRGRQNRLPTDDEKKVLRQWAGEKGLVIRA